MNVEISKVGIEYKPELHNLIAEFYGISLKDPIAKKLNSCLNEVLINPKYGSVFIIKSSVQIIGYIILTFGYSLEYGGRDAYIDEFYIKEGFRNKGIVSKALEYVVKYARTTGIKALHLEIKNKHKDAARLYERNGFSKRKSKFMTLRLE